MEGSAVHGLDVFSFEERISPLRKFSPPAITRSRKFPPGSPPLTVLEKSSETEDNTLTGAIPKKRVEGKPKSGSKSPAKHKSPGSATSKTDASQQKSSVVKPEARTPEKSHKTDSKPKSTFKSPRKAMQRCLSYLRSPKEESLEQERTRPRTRSQSKKATTEERKDTTEERKTETKIEPKHQPKTRKPTRERSSSKSAQPADKKPLISAVDKSDSDSSPLFSPRKTRKRRDPLLPSLFGKPIEDVCEIVKKSDSDSGDVIEQGISDVASGDTGDKLLSPLARLSTDPETDEDQDVDIMSVSEEEMEGESGNDPSK